MTPITTRHFGPSLEESPSPPETDSSDPYGAICQELHQLLTRKRGYYGCPDDEPLANALAVEEDGIEPYVYQLARINEKLRRLRGLRGTIYLQKIRDTVQDIAGHAIVALALLEKRK
jgi:hypothetical protein